MNTEYVDDYQDSECIAYAETTGYMDTSCDCGHSCECHKNFVDECDFPGCTCRGYYPLRKS